MSQRFQTPTAGLHQTNTNMLPQTDIHAGSFPSSVYSWNQSNTQASGLSSPLTSYSTAEKRSFFSRLSTFSVLASSLSSSSSTSERKTKKSRRLPVIVDPTDAVTTKKLLDIIGQDPRKDLKNAKHFTHGITCNLETQFLFSRIGKGSHGTVSTRHLAHKVYKTTSDRASLSKLAQEAIVQARAYAIREPRHQEDNVFFQVAKPYIAVSSKGLGLWKRLWGGEPDWRSIFSCGILSERIRPIPRHLAKEILWQFPHSRNPQRYIQSKSCMVSPFLGFECFPPKHRTKNYTAELRLGHFELYDMDLPVIDTAIGMAQALALLHWGVHMDGTGVKFVLGRPFGPDFSRRPEFNPPLFHTMMRHLLEPRKYNKKDVHDTVELWMIDFGECQELPEGPECVNCIVDALDKGDPYIPRAYPKTPELDFDFELWDLFRDRYLHCSWHYTKSEFPLRVIREIERRAFG